MNLAVSNIAWDAAEDDVVAAVLRRMGAVGIEIAPTKWRPDPLDASAADVADYRAYWAERGLVIAAMQSLVFGRPELRLFGDAHSRNALHEHLRRMIELASRLGAGAVVFGSPKNRLRGELSVDDAMQRAAEFFRGLGRAVEGCGVAVCLEPVPARYGCDFLNTPTEALALCRLADHPAIAVNADLGAMTLAGEDPITVLRDARGYIGHFHASETDFVALSEVGANVRAAAGLRAIGYDGWVSIEITARRGEDHVAAVERALVVARRAYLESRD
jgi:sugar phosphate isomerase/epimerase